MTPALAHKARGAAHSLGAPAAVLAWIDALDEALEASAEASAEASVEASAEGHGATAEAAVAEAPPQAFSLPSHFAFAARAEATRSLSPAAATLAHHGAGPDSALVVGWPTRAALAALASPAASAAEGGLTHSLLAGLPESDPLWAVLRGAAVDEVPNEPSRGLTAPALRLRVSWQHSGGGSVDVRLEAVPAPAVLPPAPTAEASASGGEAVEAWAVGRTRAWVETLGQQGLQGGSSGSGGGDSGSDRGVEVQVVRAADKGFGPRRLVTGGDAARSPARAEPSAAEAAAAEGDGGGDEVRIWFPEGASVDASLASDGATAVVDGLRSSGSGAVTRRLVDPETDPFWRSICATSIGSSGYTSIKPAGCGSWYSDPTIFWCGGVSNCNFCNPTATAAGYYYYSVFQSHCECPAGSYSAAGATSCTSCPSGFYAATSVSSSCSTCPAGRFAATGSSSCSVCGAGTESASGAASCSDCPAGKYSTGGTSAVPSCTDCVAGKYQNFDGVSFCISCPAGYYCPLGSLDYSGNPCSAGKYSGAGGSACAPCLGGFYSASSGSNFCDQVLA
jgi:hypothetical protein